MGLFSRRRRGKKSGASSRKKSFSANIPLLRWFGPSTTLAAIVGLLFMLVTGRIDLANLDQWTSNASPSADPDAVVAGPAGTSTIQPVNLDLNNKPTGTIRVATFNIRQFGPSKVADPWVMGALTQIVSQFDVIAIQEVHNLTVDPIAALIDSLRASGANYDSTVSESIGQNVGGNKEAYAYVFDQARIELVPHSDYLVQDPERRMSREPMVASFQAKLPPGDARRPFRFTLINVHTSPSRVAKNTPDNEMNVLDDVFESVRVYEFQRNQEEDYIMLGDLNVDTKRLRQLGEIPNVRSIVGDQCTNTRGTKTYDHILIDTAYTHEFNGRFGVFDLKAAFGIGEEQALKISDHLPVWAEFTAYETQTIPPQVATTNPTNRQ